MVPGLSDLNCSNSVCVKLPFLGQEDHSKKKRRTRRRRRRENIQYRQELRLPDKEYGTNKKLVTTERTQKDY